MERAWGGGDKEGEEASQRSLLEIDDVSRSTDLEK